MKNTPWTDFIFVIQCGADEGTKKKLQDNYFQT